MDRAGRHLSEANAWTLFWVGFDGWPSDEPPVDRSVEQGGTSAQCVNGVPHYSAFYEMCPPDAVQPMFPVSAGDQISADVVYSATTDQYLITVTDLTPGHSDTETEVESCPVGYACPRTSAEWIAESPSHFGTTTWFPLADYGTDRTSRGDGGRCREFRSRSPTPIGRNPVSRGRPVRPCRWPR